MEEDIFDIIKQDISQELGDVQPEPEFEMVSFTLFVQDRGASEAYPNNAIVRKMLRSTYAMICGNDMVQYSKVVQQYLGGDMHHVGAFQFICPNMFRGLRSIIFFVYHISKMLDKEITRVMVTPGTDNEIMNSNHVNVESQIFLTGHTLDTLRDHLYNKNVYISPLLYKRIIIPLYKHSYQMIDVIDDYLEMPLRDYAVQRLCQSYRCSEEIIEYDEEQTESMSEGLRNIDFNWINQYDIIDNDVNELAEKDHFRRICLSDMFEKLKWLKFIGFDIKSKQNTTQSMVICFLTKPLCSFETIYIPFVRIVFWSNKKTIRDYTTSDIIRKLKSKQRKHD